MVTSPSFSSPLRHYSCRWQQWLELLFLSCDTQRFHFSNEQLLVVGSVFAFFFSFAFRLLRLDTSLSLSLSLSLARLLPHSSSYWQLGNDSNTS